MELQELDLKKTAKKIDQITEAYGNFVMTLDDEGLQGDLVTKVIFALSGEVIVKIEGADELMHQVTNIMRRIKTNEDDTKRDPVEPGKNDGDHRRF